MTDFANVDVPPAYGEVAYEEALARLPPAYAQALRFAESGCGEDEICRRLEIEPEGLEPLLDLARRKLRKELTHP